MNYPGGIKMEIGKILKVRNLYKSDLIVALRKMNSDLKFLILASYNDERRNDNEYVMVKVISEKERDMEASFINENIYYRMKNGYKTLIYIIECPKPEIKDE